MLGAAAEKDAAVTAMIDILGLGEAEKLGVEALGGIDIGNEQLDRADLVTLNGRCNITPPTQ